MAKCIMALPGSPSPRLFHTVSQNRCDAVSDAHLYQAKETDCGENETSLSHVDAAIESSLLESGYAALVTLEYFLVRITRRRRLGGSRERHDGFSDQQVLRTESRQQLHTGKFCPCHARHDGFEDLRASY